MPRKSTTAYAEKNLTPEQYKAWLAMPVKLSKKQLQAGELPPEHGDPSADAPRIPPELEPEVLEPGEKPARPIGADPTKVYAKGKAQVVKDCKACEGTGEFLVNGIVDACSDCDPNRRPPASAKQIQEARDEYREEGTVEIDDDATLSIPEDGSGVWVQAWVWLDKKDYAEGEGQ